MSDENIREWARAAQGGDINAFAKLVECYHRGVRACLAARLDDPHEAEDLAQEVFITAFKKIGEFDHDRPMEPWLRSIAFNHLRNHWRKFRAHAIGGNAELAAMLDQRVAAECGPEQESRLFAALRECLEQIDGPGRELLRRRYGEEQSVRELAVLLNRGYSALTMQLHRLRELLAGCIDQKLSAPSV